VTTTARRRACALALALVLATLGAAAAAEPVHTVRTDLRPLIRAASQSPVQFAVLVPHAVSTASGGTWSSANGRATWRYAVQVPTAVSLSFHAIKISFPASATLVVRGARTTTSYRARDLHRGELWSRVQPGAGLDFTLTVAAAERAQVSFSIVSLQAGYRSLGAGVEDHPYYRQLKAQAAASTGDTACVTNYECKITSANTPAGAATVALLVQNQFECTGTLINDVPGDNTPYILSAKHCISGKVGVVDDPSAAASATTVYWDATTNCGAALGSIYDANIPTQAGAVTLVEQQDAWLIRLDVNPVVSDAQFAGFDASGATVNGGYTVHHAEGYDKQFVAWFGQPASVSVFAGFANFLETVNQTGNIGPGASGGALFDQNNHLVGSLTYGRNTSDPSGYGACPVATPPAPDGTNGVADFTALAAVWSATGDIYSSTGAATIKSVLDPQSTGTVVVPSAPASAISFEASTATQVYGQPLQLTWSASNATQCTAGGGLAGDGWSGTLAAAGSQTLTESASNSPTTYTLSCSYPGARTAKASVSVTWEGPAPVVSLVATPAAVWTTRPVTLSWTSNVTPCSLNGGTLALTNLAASGTTTTTAATSADVTYTLSCGAGNDRGVTATLVQYATPGVIFEANGTDRQLGQLFTLYWQSFADSCTGSGGAPDDGWSGNNFLGGAGSTLFSPQVTATGTYTYTLSCSSGALTAQQSVTVTFENTPAYVTASLNQASVAFSASPADYVTLSWNSNLSHCSPSLPSGLLASPNDPFGLATSPQGGATLTPLQSGRYAITVTCNPLNPGPVTSAPLTLTVTPPAPPTAMISFNPEAVVAGETFTVSWSSTLSSSCSRTGGIPGDGWISSMDAPAGSLIEVAMAGQFSFGLSCFSIDPSTPSVSTQAQLAIAALSETFLSSASSVSTGSSFTLSWNTTGATSCTASGGGADGSPWSGTLAPSGSVTQSATTNGTFTYELDCGVNNEQTAQSVTVKVAAPGAAAGAGSAGGGGGGTIGVLELAVLLGLIRRRRRTHRFT
jgi:hypothetical protein